MGAIWGTIAFKENFNTGFDKMKPAFVKKCRLDLFSEKNIDNCQMGAGILFVREKDRREVLPIVSDDGNIVITADCILDNAAELAGKLGSLVEMNEMGRPSPGKSGVDKLTDGQIIMGLFLKYGTESFHMLRGLFSLAIWDKKAEKLMLVADPVSARCLYYRVDQSAVHFSTLIDPIIEAVGGALMDMEYLEDFMMAPGLMPNLFSVYTPYKGIKKLNAGEWVEITAGGARCFSYVDSVGGANYGGLVDKDAPKDIKKIGKEFRKLFEACVSDAVVTDGQVGVSLSSGLDSASIAAVAANELGKCGAADGDVVETAAFKTSIAKVLHAYTYIPSEEYKEASHKSLVLDETRDVRLICESFKNIDNQFLNNSGRNCIEDIDKILDIMEIPFKAFVNFPNLAEIMERAATDGCKVVLTGQTGNASISHGYIDDVLYDLYENKSWGKFFKYMFLYCRANGEKFSRTLRSCLGYFKYSDKVISKGVTSLADVNEFLRDDFTAGYPYKERFEAARIRTLETIPMDEKGHKAFLYNKAILAYMGEYETKLGLKYGVVIRDPSKDIRLIRFCYSIPHFSFAYNGIPRWLIRGNFRDLIPAKILDDWNRYGVQNADWIDRVERDWVAKNYEAKLLEVLDDKVLEGYIDKARVRDFLAKPFTFEDRYIDKALSEVCYIHILGKLINRI